MLSCVVCAAQGGASSFVHNLISLLYTLPRELQDGEKHNLFSNALHIFHNKGFEIRCIGIGAVRIVLLRHCEPVLKLPWHMSPQANIQRATARRAALSESESVSTTVKCTDSPKFDANTGVCTAYPSSVKNRRFLTASPQGEALAVPPSESPDLWVLL